MIVPKTNNNKKNCCFLLLFLEAVASFLLCHSLSWCASRAHPCLLSLSAVASTSFGLFIWLYKLNTEQRATTKINYEIQQNIFSLLFCIVNLQQCTVKQSMDKTTVTTIYIKMRKTKHCIHVTVCAASPRFLFIGWPTFPFIWI